MDNEFDNLSKEKKLLLVLLSKDFCDIVSCEDCREIFRNNGCIGGIKTWDIIDMPQDKSEMITEENKNRLRDIIDYVYDGKDVNVDIDIKEIMGMINNLYKE